MKFALLLCTYNDDSRKRMYEDVINWWILRKEFDIYIVDSSDNVFSKNIEETTKTYHFDQRPLSDSKNQTVLELISLNKAFSIFGEQWQNYDYIIKLTSKYMLPELSNSFLSKHVNSVDYEVICQYKTKEYGNKDWQNTELILFNSRKMLSVIDKLHKLQDKGDLEKRMWHFSRNTNFFSLPKLKNIAKYKRKIGDYLSFL